MKNAKKEKAPPKMWVDAQGREIPDNYVNKSDKFADKTLKSLNKKAKSLQEAIRSFKEEMFEKSALISEKILTEHNRPVPEEQASVTHFNFDRSIKLQIKNQKSIMFDETLINEAKRVLLKEFLSEKLTGSDEAVVKIIMHAFVKQNGQLNTDNILSLRQYEQQINDEKYSEAMKLITDAIKYGKSKLYPAIFERDESGQYKAINLNLSSL